MPTILQINTCANWGSTGRIAEQINQCASKVGWNIYFAYGDPALPSCSKLIRIGNVFSRAEALLEARILDNDGLASRYATEKLIDTMRNISPDIIHIHNLHGYYINYKILFEFIIERNIPVVWTLHDFWGITGHCTHFVLEKCEKWKSECGLCPAKNKYPKSFACDASKKNFMLKKSLLTSIPRLRIVTVSRWMRDLVANSYLKDRDISVIPNGVDVNVFYPRLHTDSLRDKYKINGKFLIIATGTTWHPYKGINDYLLLRKVLPDEFAIMLVGLSNKEIKRLPKGIIGLPRTSSQDELALLYSMADCVMSLSRLESFGLTPVEGFACGTPAIVYDNVALSELITSETGLKVPVGNIEDLKKSVIEIKNKGKSFYTANCRKRAIDFFDKNQCFGEYIRLYNSVLGI